MKKRNILEYVAWFFVVIGVLALSGSFAIKSCDFFANESIGELAGGVGGSLLALAGVFLFYHALIVQQKNHNQNIGLLQNQMFETSFFEMLKTLSQIKVEIIIPEEIKNQSGIGKFGKALSFVVSDYRTLWDLENFQVDRLVSKLPENKGLKIHQELEMNYFQFDLTELEFQPWYYMITTILKRIDNHNFLKHEEKLHYAKLLFASMVRSERAFIMLLALENTVDSDLPVLLGKYGVLDTNDFRNLGDFEEPVIAIYETTENFYDRLHNS